MTNPAIKVTLFFFLALILIACTSDSDPENGTSIPYTDIDPASGFSAEYLQGKSFFRPENYFGNEFIYVYNFSGGNVAWSDNLFMENGFAPFTIIEHNGIQGILQYYDDVYDLFYSVHSVETDHLNLCYAYGDINMIAACDISETLKWYFDRATAELNYP